MLGQLSFDSNGVLRDKVELAIQRLKAFEPPEGYYVAFSGGKDSQCVYHLCKMAGVKFDAHYAVTSVDPPELVKFIRKNYPDVEFVVPHDKNGKRVSMWTLIPEWLMPPTMTARYCCEQLKETQGECRATVTGVRWAESVNRRKNQGVVTVVRKNKKMRKEVEDMGIEYANTRRGGIVLNYDDATQRRVSEFCIRTGKVLINPIIDWDDDDVWEFLNGNGIEHCCLYDEGFKRLGCIGCPMAGGKRSARDFARYPKYKQMYLNAFRKMIENRKAKGLGIPEKWQTPEKVMSWWLQEEPQLDGQVGLEELIE